VCKTEMLEFLSYKTLFESLKGEGKEWETRENGKISHFLKEYFFRK